MFLEANIPIAGSASLTDQRDWAGTAVALGYHGVAFNVFKGPNEKVEPRERCGVKAVPMDTLQATRERVRLALKGAQPLLDDAPSFTQLVRVTAAVDEGGPDVIAERLPTVVGIGYDLAAVQPLNGDSFLSACFNSKVGGSGSAVEEGGPEVIAGRLPTVVGIGYDLAAVQPLNNDSFLSACFNSKVCVSVRQGVKLTSRAPAHGGEDRI
ncbi:unnamed protein product [Closterium sp. Naga37s-1]|nr:unnamed protein product [Closterium sp. Naga37s-1]